MQLISAHNGKLQTLTRTQITRAEKVFRISLDALDMLAPAGGFARGSIHEILSQQPAEFFAAVIALAAVFPLSRYSEVTMYPWWVEGTG